MSNHYHTIIPFIYLGTRSKTGQLLEFKKGPFHPWDHLRVPVVPLVIFGAYELYPPGHQMNVPGVIYVKMLKPIQCAEAKDKDEMSLLVRKRMLESIKQCPADVASPITWMDRIYNLIGISAIWAIDYYLIKFAHHVLVNRFGFSGRQILYGFLGFTAFISPSVYVYAVYMMPKVSSLLSKFYSKSSSKNKQN